MSKQRTTVISIILIIIILCSASYIVYRIRQSSRPTPSQNNEYSILKGAVDVDAIIDAENDEDPSLPRVYDITVNISKGADSYQCESVCVDCDSVGGVLARLRSLIAWEGKYLLIPVSCGGGNAWRCDVVEVFMLSNSRLIRVGQAGSDVYKESRLGKFHDIYDKLEINDLTSHADAPGFIIIMHEENGDMVANLMETWQENQGRYSDNQSFLDRIAKNSDPASIVDLKTLPPLLFNSVLTKYCQKKDELNHWSSVAKLLLDQASKAQLDSLVAIVTPGELPSSDQYE